MVEDVYLLALHEPYTTPDYPVPINAFVVHAQTLLHPGVPQPDGGRVYRCLTEFPGRTEGSLVPLSKLTYELDGGALWAEVGDWESVVDSIVQIHRDGRCDAMPLGLPEVPSRLIGGGPQMVLDVHQPDGSIARLGPDERQRHLEELSGHLQRFLADGPLWPGDGLVQPPTVPAVMPYRPFG